MKLYELTPHHTPACTIFAHSKESAITIYTEHQHTHGSATALLHVKRIDHQQPWAQDKQLKNAFSLKIEGIGVHNPEDGTWLIEPPYRQMSPVSETPLPLRDHGMHISLTVLDSGKEMVVFGRSPARAQAIAMRFMSMIAEIPDDWSGVDWSTYKKHGKREQLDFVLACREEGLGSYDSESGWMIIPLPEEMMRDLPYEGIIVR